MPAAAAPKEGANVFLPVGRVQQQQEGIPLVYAHLVQAGEGVLHSVRAPWEFRTVIGQVGLFACPESAGAQYEKQGKDRDAHAVAQK
jgi:hypothetical protein